MDLVNYLKPNVEKIKILLMLVAVTFVAIVAFIISGFFLVLLGMRGVFDFLSKSILMLVFTPVMWIVIITIAYLFSCYIANNKKNTAKAIIAYLISLLVLSVGFSVSIDVYNQSFGFSCEKDSDCKVNCGPFSFNDRYYDPSPVDFWCLLHYYPVCENKRCASFDVRNPTSEAECNRITQEYTISDCYHYLELENLLRSPNPNSCENLNANFTKEECYSRLAIKLNDSSFCDKIRDAVYEKMMCRRYFSMLNQSSG